MADLKARPQVSDFAKEPDYALRFKQSYPFHPYLLDILNRYLGANPKFQRTRGVLRLLALVVADLAKRTHNGGLIQASDIDLNNEEIRSELLELVDREFRSALEADIIGAGANAVSLDKQSAQMTRWRIASGCNNDLPVHLRGRQRVTGRDPGGTAPRLGAARGRFRDHPGRRLADQGALPFHQYGSRPVPLLDHPQPQPHPVAQLQTEKANGAKGVRQQILRAYRHIAWGGSNEDPLKTLDMGQPPATTEQSLSELVVAFLKEKQKYLEQIASILLVHPTKLAVVWPEEEPVLSLKALPGYFRNFTHLPILRDDEVLRQAVVDGVRAGHFALCEGTSADDAKILHYKTTITTTAVVLEDGYLLIRPTLADQKIAEAEAKAAEETPAVTVTPPVLTGVSQPTTGTGTTTIITGGNTPTGGTGVPATGSTEVTGKDGKPHRLNLSVEVPFTDFHTFYTGIINALGRNADHIKIKVQIEASSEAGFSPTLIEDTVKETLFNLFRTDESLRINE